MKLEGKTALVTGGTRGIGLAITRALRREGARVIAVGKAKDQIELFRREFSEDPLATAEYADVRMRGDLEALRDRIQSDGGLDILVPNAGVNTRVKALDLPDAALREMLETNLYGVFVTCQVFGPLLLARPGGRVVVTGSLSSIHGMDLRAAYTATKAGISGLVRSLAIEWGPSGVTVNAVGPGIIRTPLTTAYMEQFPERVKASIENTPLRRLGEPEDVADVVAFLASDAARFITGQTIYIDGGISAGSSWW
ncbi:MAG TPA: SDR family NAD(P)-dependent oxidoreductase [Candidatus Dormibacteraeota bacterium]|nr:SDR family NAD(P)-dependent oxidoreductase [Candidatus Dormibacteraeota bacterium]